MDEEEFYSPRSLKDIFGNNFAVSQIIAYAKEVNKGVARKPLLVAGPSGTGKTATVHLIAEERGWNIVEMNAGDYRDAESINKIAATAASSRHLFGGKNLILFDEIDELMPRFDTGASSAIEKLISNSKSPIIFIADDQWSQSIRFLRNRVDVVQFKKLDNASVRDAVHAFEIRSGISLDERIVDLIVAKSAGDARSAINDAWALAGATEFDAEALGTRNRKEEIFGVLDKIFRAYTFSASLFAVTNAEEEQSMLINWIGENLPGKYLGKEEKAHAFDNLALATLYLGRASKSQYYTYWRYANVLMSAGVSLAKEQPPNMMGRYTYPRAIKSLSESKEDRNAKAKIAEKLAQRLHSGTKRIVMNELKLIEKEIKKMAASEEGRAKVGEFLEKEFGLEEKEVSYLIELSAGKG
ncbi:MAG: replication factor C large subunit [Candidatus Micrarchaeia archaeon]